jgi:hypothetical protein
MEKILYSVFKKTKNFNDKKFIEIFRNLKDDTVNIRVT